MTPVAKFEPSSFGRLCVHLLVRASGLELSVLCDVAGDCRNEHNQLDYWGYAQK